MLFKIINKVNQKINELIFVNLRFLTQKIVFFFKVKVQ